MFDWGSGAGGAFSFGFYIVYAFCIWVYLSRKDNETAKMREERVARSPFEIRCLLVLVPWLLSGGMSCRKSKRGLSMQTMIPQSRLGVRHQATIRLNVQARRGRVEDCWRSLQG